MAIRVSALQPAGAAGGLRGGPAAAVADGGIAAAAPHSGSTACGEQPSLCVPGGREIRVERVCGRAKGMKGLCALGSVCIRVIIFKSRHCTFQVSISCV